MIIFAGVIGAGKTTYAKRLAETLGSRVFLEEVDDTPILTKYYEDAKRYAFSLQIHFLNKRFELIKEAFNENDTVLDRSIYEDQVFAWANMKNGNISPEEWQIYTDLLDNMMEELEGTPKKAPDLLIYLDVSFEHELANIKKRGRKFEQIETDTTLLTYYKQLYDQYQDWINHYDASEVLKIPADQYDIFNPNDWESVYGMIQERMDALNPAAILA
ncbi:MAG: deoxynucleoside kinase [Aerococcus sp.]|nr:deoxynucleoside kinase [Aerococcus sp.]